jgi:hypothetical protein
MKKIRPPWGGAPEAGVVTMALVAFVGAAIPKTWLNARFAHDG